MASTDTKGVPVENKIEHDTTLIKRADLEKVKSADHQEKANLKAKKHVKSTKAEDVKTNDD